MVEGTNGSVRGGGAREERGFRKNGSPLFSRFDLNGLMCCFGVAALAHATAGTVLPEYVWERSKDMWGANTVFLRMFFDYPFFPISFREVGKGG